MKATLLRFEQEKNGYKKIKSKIKKGFGTLSPCKIHREREGD